MNADVGCEVKEPSGTLFELTNHVPVEASSLGAKKRRKKTRRTIWWYLEAEFKARYELVVQVEAFGVLAIYIEERALHLGKREPIAVVKLVNRVQEVAVSPAGYFEDLLEAVVGKEGNKRVS